MAGCSKQCEPAAPCATPAAAATSDAPLPAAKLRHIEGERESLEAIREAIESDHRDGTLSLEHYKRQMARYTCGIRTYQAATRRPSNSPAPMPIERAHSTTPQA